MIVHAGFLILLPDHIRQAPDKKGLLTWQRGSKSERGGGKKSIQASEALTFRS
jgi:hypothetical protein